MIRAHLPAQLVIFVPGFAIEVTMDSATTRREKWRSDRTVVVKAATELVLDADDDLPFPQALNLAS
jgi:hypothetical protein